MEERSTVEKADETKLAIVVQSQIAAFSLQSIRLLAAKGLAELLAEPLSPLPSLLSPSNGSTRLQNTTFTSFYPLFTYNPSVPLKILSNPPSTTSNHLPSSSNVPSNSSCTNSLLVSLA